MNQAGEGEGRIIMDKSYSENYVVINGELNQKMRI